MDHLVTEWQSYVSLVIVAIAAVSIVRRMMKQRRDHRCDSCALIDQKNTAKYRK